MREGPRTWPLDARRSGATPTSTGARVTFAATTVAGACRGLALAPNPRSALQRMFAVLLTGVAVLMLIEF